MYRNQIVQNRKGHIIIVTNQKGGTGKTTTACNLSACLYEMGYKVLMLDADKQCNLTSCLVRDSERAMRKNIGTLMERVLDGKKINVGTSIISTRIGDIIAGNRTLYSIQADFKDRKDSNTIYRDLLEDVRYSYDYIIIDCPPEASQANAQSYTAATHVLIVTEPTYYSIDGIPDAYEFAQYAKKCTNSHLNILGILINNVHRRKVDREYVGIIREDYHDVLHVFDTVIPASSGIASAPSQGKSVFQHRKNDKSIMAYRSFTTEFIERIDNHG